jgi:dihydrolipoamide dehydrogenase
VHIVGPSAAEIINEASALMSMEVTAYEIAGIIHGHPTYSEAFMEAAADSIGICNHLPLRNKSKEGI